MWVLGALKRSKPRLSFYLPSLVISSLAPAFLFTFLFLTISLPHSAALILNLPLNSFTLSVTHVSNRQSSQWPLSNALLRELSPGKEAPAPKGNLKHTHFQAQPWVSRGCQEPHLTVYVTPPSLLPLWTRCIMSPSWRIVPYREIQSCHIAVVFSI